MQAFGAMSSMRNMLDVLREVSLDELRQQAELAPSVLVVGPSSNDARRLALALTGPEGSFATMAHAVDEPIDSLGRIDAAVVWDPERTGAGSRVGEALRFVSPAPPIVRFESASPDDLNAIERVRAEILKRNPDRAPAFGRMLPAFRAAAAKQVIDETAMANAQFSLVSNIPTLLPIVGNIAAAGADFIVLTKNQVMMLYKLGAVFGRDLQDKRGILQEVLPVVGAGLVWRTVARQATTWLPFAAGTIPKLVIAYVGTMAVGRGAEFYYRTGMKPSRSQMEQFARQAAELLRGLNLPVVRNLVKEKDGGRGRIGAPSVTVIENDRRREMGSGWRE